MSNRTVVYNMPFQCLNTCPSCYLKSTFDTRNLDTGAGLRTLTQKLADDKKANFIISITHNPLSYAHTKYVLKKTRHARKSRHTSVIVNIENLKVGQLLSAVEGEEIDEVSISCRPYNHAKAVAIIPAIKEALEVEVGTILTVDKEEVEEIDTAITALTATGITYLTPIIDEVEVVTMARSARIIPLLEKHIENENLHASPCMGKFQSAECCTNDDEYMEIEGQFTIHGCPYRVKSQCKQGKKDAADTPQPGK